MHSNARSVRALAPSIRWSALRRLAEGDTPTEVTRKLNLPHCVVKQLEITYARDIQKIVNNKLRNREAFHHVVARYNDFRSVMGSPGAMDYAHMTSGSGAKYAPFDGILFKAIDFTVDVDNTVKEVLTSEEQTFWKENIQDKDYDLTVQSEMFLSFQEFLGHEFISRGLHPVADYFGDKR